MEEPTEINAVDDPDPAGLSPGSYDFRGEIEFRDVWFRYPTRPNEWVFKGLNLTIKPNDCIAIVGESGQGKSTMINLIMRFYDPDFGQVLIDGKDARDYPVQELRLRMGLVMQEPTLFNYSIKENILYGNRKASNAELLRAAEVANACEFIESPELENAFESNAASLLTEWTKPQYKEELSGELGAEKWEEYRKELEDQKNTELKEGKAFDAVENELDTRTAEEAGNQPLHPGYAVAAGIKGSKLSGGQKQRVAIARAVIR